MNLKFCCQNVTEIKMWQLTAVQVGEENIENRLKQTGKKDFTSYFCNNISFV